MSEVFTIFMITVSAEGVFYENNSESYLFFHVGNPNISSKGPSITASWNVIVSQEDVKLSRPRTNAQKKPIYGNVSSY